MRNNRRFFYIFITLNLILMTAGTISDLSVSDFLYDRDSMFARSINWMAMLPRFMFLIFNCCKVFGYKKRNGINYIPDILVLSVITFLALREINRGFEINPVLLAAVSIILTILTVIAVIISDHEISYGDYMAAKKIILAALEIVVITSAIKILWGRRRYFTMDDEIRQFSYWFRMNRFSFSDHYHSFPSGHTSFATLVFGWPALMNIKGNRKHAGITIVLCLFWILAVMLGRIVYGAHFLSDTGAGRIIGASCVYWAMERIYRRI